MFSRFSQNFYNSMRLVKQKSCISLLKSNEVCQAPMRYKSNQSVPINTVAMFVPQEEIWIIERMGKFNRMLEPGLNFLIPLIDKIRHVQSMKEMAVEVPKTGATTIDHVNLTIDGILFVRVRDPYLASYGVEDPEYALSELVHSTVRAELGMLTVNDILKETSIVRRNVIKRLNAACYTPWGIDCIRYEIRNINLPLSITQSMALQAEIERKNKASILEAEGLRNAEIKLAEGKNKAKIIESEVIQKTMKDKANTEAEVLRIHAEAQAKCILTLAKAFSSGDKSIKEATAASLAHQYLCVLENMAKTNNGLVISGDIQQSIKALSTVNDISKTIGIQTAQESNPE